MLGERSAQRGLFAADTLFADFVGRRNFYGFLASQRDELFRDEDFAGLFSARLLDCGPILCRAAPRTSSSSFRAVAR